MDRLEHLEQQNRELMTEIRSLRQQLAGTVEPAGAPAPPGPESPPAEERIAVQEQRVAELEQSKVGAQQKLPVTLTGTVLFNAFRNGTYNGDQMNPIVASAEPGGTTGGGTLRQTVLGVKFGGPALPWGGKASGALYFDFFAGTGTSLNQLVRLRIATLDLDWKNTTVSFAQDKPIIAPREPDSLAQVGVSPLTGAGNLWLWQPQFRVEQRFALPANTGLRAQFGIYQTNEAGTGISSEYSGTLARSRPGWEGRLLWWGGGEDRRFEIAPGFHYSTTKVLGVSVPSRIYSVDWLLRPFARVDFTGQFFDGVNVGVIGGLRQSVQISEDGFVRPVATQGGWAQLTIKATRRMSFHLYGGQEDDRNSDLTAGAIAKNQTYAGNLMYHIAANVIGSFEASQVRTTYVGTGTRLNPHYDLAIAYLF